MKSWNREHPLQAALRDSLEAPQDGGQEGGVTTPSRRTVIKLTGLTGLALGFSLPKASFAMTPPESGDFAPNGYIRLGADGEIRIYAPNAEIGQGVKTALPIIVAKEMGADWDDVRVEQAPVDAEAFTFGRQSAGGSRSVPATMESLRRAGASARLMLESAAAERWRVPAGELRTLNSRVRHEASGKSASFAELAETAAKQPVPNVDHVLAKTRKDFSFGDRQISGVDNHALVTGAPLFGIDQQLPGMRYATFTKSAAAGGLVKSFNRDAILALPGVSDAFVIDPWNSAMELRSGVAIIADSTWQAISAKKALAIEWDLSQAASDDAQASLEQALALDKTQGAREIQASGEAEAEYGSAQHKVSASYAYPFLSHAPLEPQNCTAWYKGDDEGIEIWAPSQAIQMGHALTMQMLGLPPDKVVMHQTRAGGGFGRRLANDYVLEVAAIAKRVRAPVKLQWTREDDMAHDHHRAAGAHHFRAGLDAAGNVLSFQNHHVTFTADGEKPVRGGGYGKGEFPALAVKNTRITQSLLPWDTPAGFWRAPNSNGIAFATQSFLHEMSVAAGRDHVAFLLDLLDRHPPPENARRGFDPKRAKGVLQALAPSMEKPVAGTEANRAQGLAFYFSHAGYVSILADLSVSDDKKIRVHQVDVGVDVGPIVHESGARNQCEGSVIDAMSTLMGLEITCREGCAEQDNFHLYPLGRMSIAPERIGVTFVDSDAPSTGLGEPAFPPVAPAICNAIFNATGERLRQFPLARFGYSYA